MVLMSFFGWVIHYERTEWLRFAGLGSVKHTADKPYSKWQDEFTDEIEFYLPKNNAFPFLARIQISTVKYYAFWYHIHGNLCNRGMRLMQDGAACQSACTTICFCKLTEWMFWCGHPVLLTLTPSSTFGMWLAGRSEEVLEMSGNYSILS